MDTVLLTAVEVASVLRISTAHLYKIVRSGEMPSVRFGRSVRVKREALDAFILKNVSEGDENGPSAIPAEDTDASNEKEVNTH